MAETRDRVRRLLDSELGNCCEADVQHRLEQLETLREGTASAVERDRDVFSTLGDGTRLRLVRYLDAAERALCVCELEALIDVSESAVSHALSDLADVGLVTREKRGKWRYYEATERASAVLSALDGTRSADDAGQQSAGGEQ